MKRHTLVDDVDDLIEFRIRRSKPILRTHADKVIEWVPTALAGAAAVHASNGTSEFGKRAIQGLLALGLQKGVVHLVKHTTNHVRPNPFDKHNSFPSGHTATAFMGAALLQAQLQKKDKAWASVGYAIAVGTGLLRLYQNRHWLSDVVLGAGVGVLAVAASRKLMQLASSRRISRSQTSTASRWIDEIEQ